MKAAARYRFDKKKNPTQPEPSLKALIQLLANRPGILLPRTADSTLLKKVKRCFSALPLIFGLATKILLYPCLLKYLDILPLGSSTLSRRGPIRLNPRYLNPQPAILAKLPSRVDSSVLNVATMVS